MGSPSTVDQKREAEAAVTTSAQEEGTAPERSDHGADERVPTESGKGPESASEGEVDEAEDTGAQPPLPGEPVPTGGPPLPDEPAPQQQEDDGWDCQFDPHTQAWFFHNRFTGHTQWENPRVPTADGAAAAPGVAAAPGTAAAAGAAPLPPAHEKPVAGGYNPAIHGDYDPTAWYAQPDAAGGGGDPTLQQDPSALGAIDPYAATATFNRFTGQFQTDGAAERHGDEAKSRRQMNAFFDVDAAANSHDGRSLKAERSNKKPSKQELKAFKEKRKARKEEKRRAWLRD